MRKIVDLQTLPFEELEIIEQIWPPRALPRNCDILYEDHYPCQAIVFISGKVTLKRRKKVMTVMEAGQVFGIHALLKGQPIKYTVSVSKGTKVCFLDKTTLLELISKEKSPSFLEELLAKA